MVKYDRGPGCAALPQRLMTRDIASSSRGELPTACGARRGHLIDDGTVFRLGDSEYRLCTGERQLDWLLDSSLGFDVQISEVTEETAALRCRVRLPAPCSGHLPCGIERLKPFELGHFGCQRSSAPMAIMVRAPFTVTWATSCGCARRMRRRMDALMEAGPTARFGPSVRAPEHARIEAGFLLPNVDFVSSERTLR